MRTQPSPALTPILDEISRAFESVEDPETRVDRVLRVMGRLVPYDRCALLEADPMLAREVSVLPSASAEERDRLAARLAELLRLFEEQPLEQVRALVAPRRRRGPFHLAVPIVGLGTMAGILLVERAAPPYDETQLALLSVVASLIGSYLSLTRADRDLRSSEARFRGLYESGMIGIAFMDDEGTITDANQTFARIAGRDRADLRARAVNWHDMTPAEFLDRDRAAIREARDRGVASPYEKRFIRRDGRQVTVLAGAARLDTPRAFGAFVLDISEQKRIENERERLLSEREEDLRFLELFMGMLGHDLRNPLGAIRLLAERLRRSTDADHFGQTIARILASTDRMERMVAQLLDVTRIRLAGGMPLERAHVDLGELCNGVLDELRAARPDASVELSIAGDVSGEWDADGLLQVVSNLTTNAVQHARGAPEVELRVVGTDGSVELSTHNWGAIPPHLLPVLFDPFRRAAPHGPRTGLGLGLFITKHIVEAHGGSIHVSSSESEGTQFTVRLPRIPPGGARGDRGPRGDRGHSSPFNT